MRRALFGAVAFGVAVGVAMFAARSWMAGGSDPDVTFWGAPRSSIEFTPDARQSAAFVSSMERVRNELPFRRSWTDDEAAFVVSEIGLDLSEYLEYKAELVAGEAVSATRDERREMAEGEIRRTFSILLASDALRLGMPMSDAARAEMEASLMELLEDADGYYRMMGVNAMFETGMVEREAVYQWLNDMSANDPEEVVRRKVQYDLNQYDTLGPASGGG